MKNLILSAALCLASLGVPVMANASPVSESNTPVAVHATAAQSKDWGDRRGDRGFGRHEDRGSSGRRVYGDHRFEGGGGFRGARREVDHRFDRGERFEGRGWRR